jgi:hypothetical protein
MTPAEELFDIERDPLELRNLAADPASRSTLEEMRRAYDAELELWKAKAVPYNDYRRFGTLFDRNVPWDEKASRLTKEKGPGKKKRRR